MSDEPSIPSSEKPDPKEGQNLPPLSCDPFLQLLVGITNDLPWGDQGLVSITLQVGGILVTGMLASGRGFFSSQKNGFVDAWKRWANASGVEHTDKATGAFARLFENYENLYAGDGTDPAPRPLDPPPDFIHVRNARLYLKDGRPIPSDGGTWWRGKLSSVDAFWLGELNQLP